MAYSLKRSAEFTTQLRRAVAYVHDMLCSPQAAKAILDELERQLRLVANYPKWFPLDQEMSDRFGLEIHRFAVRSYCAYYLVNEPAKTIQLITFRHRSQDISTYDSYDLYEN